MSLIASVAVNIPGVSGIFDYWIPPDLQEQVIPGCLVTAPFGTQTVQGIVTDLPETSPVLQLKTIIDLLDPTPVVNPAQIQLAHWMAEEYYSSFGDFLQLMIPNGLNQQADTLFSLKLPEEKTKEDRTELQKRIIQLIQKRGPLRGRQIDNAIPRQNWRVAAKSLIKNGVLASSSVLPKPTVNKKMIKTAQLGCPVSMAVEHREKMARPGSAALSRRQAILDFLIKESVPINVAWVYAETNGNLADLHAMEEQDLVILRESEIWRDPLEKVEFLPDSPPELTDDQQSAWMKIQTQLKTEDVLPTQKPILIHGVTGSGKTELYLRAVDAILQQGEKAIILVPEISLTPQTVKRFMARFPGQVGLIHSRLSPGERYDTWRRARNGQLSVIIGPRSALFTSLPNIGLIVLDECHDDSYYQTDLHPFYYAVGAAIEYGRITGATVLLGSATPAVETFYRARMHEWKIIELPNRILAHQEAVKKRLDDMKLNRKTEITPLNTTAASLPMPFVHIVDMREELKEGNRSIFSRMLLNSLGETLRNEEQAILFLNRRGSATYIFCRDCGFVVRCPHCDLPLTMHADSQMLICHTCGYQRLPITICPQCGNSHIREFGTGTEKVEEMVIKQFPQARVLRWDADTVKQKGAEDILLSHFIEHRADILIGTQMLAKGLDLPFVTLVGVILADVGLNFPDYRSPERTFQILTQVSGRAGRSILGGKVILQTFQPWHYAIQRAAEHDFDGFYELELENRRKLRYPPFSELARIEINDLNWSAAKEKIEEMAKKITFWLEEQTIGDIEMIGPAPAFFAKVRGYYRWQLLLRGKNLRRILKIIPVDEVKIEINPPAIL